HAGVDLDEGLGDLRDAPAEVDRDDDAAGPQRAGEELVVAVGVEGEDRGPLAVLDAEVLQGTREPGDAVDRLRVGPGSAVADGGDLVPTLLDRPVQSLREIHA